MIGDDPLGLGNTGTTTERVDPPGEVLLLNEVEFYQQLPWQGGLMDQPDITMDLLALCVNIRKETEVLKRVVEGANNASLNPLALPG